MKGAREQLLDIKSKTQYQSSRCMEQCDTPSHTSTLHDSLSWTGWLRLEVCVIYEDTASVSFGQDALSTLYLLLGTGRVCSVVGA